MGTARQVVRWSLPGLLFVLNFVLFHALWLALTAKTGSPWVFINEANAPALIALVAGGLPAGFLLYQFYFANYRPVSRWFGFLTPNGRPHYYRADRAGNMLRTYSETFGGPLELLVWLDAHGTTIEGLRDRLRSLEFERSLFRSTRLPLLMKLKRNGHLHEVADGPSVDHARSCRTCAVIYEDRWRKNWTLFQTFMDYVGRDDTYRHIKVEYTSHSDLYHALGSARSTIFLSLLATGAYELVIRAIAYGTFLSFPAAGPHYVLFFVLVGAAAIVEYLILSACRDRLTEDYESRIAAALSAAVRTRDPREFGGAVASSLSSGPGSRSSTSSPPCPVKIMISKISAGRMTAGGPSRRSS